MKNITLGLNIVLAVAVAVLFYLHFSSKKSVTAPANAAAVSGGFRIAYFEMDSIQSQFEYFKEVRSTLNSKDQELGRELASMENNFRNKYQDLQKVGSTLSQAEVANRQQELVEMDKNLKSRKQMMDQEMQDESLKKLQDVKKKIEDYLKDYNKDKGYSYIFAGSPDLIYYKDTVYNITGDMLKGLNELYKKKK